MSEHQLWIAGEHVPTRDHFGVINPATGEVAGMAQDGTVEDVDRAVASAKAVFQSWRAAS